jgi:hypothetical protein
LETNLSGNLHRSRNVAERRYHPRDFILPSVLAAAKRSKLTRNQPEVFLKLLVLLVPREMKVEHSAAVKAMTQEQLEAAIEAIQAMLSTRAGEQGQGDRGRARAGGPRRCARAQAKVRKSDEASPMLSQVEGQGK